MFTLSDTLYSTRTRGRPCELHLHNSFIEVRKHFLYERIIVPWKNVFCLQLQDIFQAFFHLNVLINTVDLTSRISFEFLIACDVSYGAISVFYTFSNRWNFTNITLHCLTILFDFM